MAVELGLTPDSRWQSDTTGLVGAARRAGFSTLGLSAARVDEGAAAAFKSAGLRCHELLALVLTEDGPATVSSAEQLAESAALIGAQWVLTSLRATLTDATADTIRRCAAIVAQAGAGLAIEFSPLGPVRSITAGLEIVQAAGAGRAGLLIDSWHFSFGDSTWEDLETVPLEQIAYVQFDDALEPVSDDLMDETLNRRAMPGEGVLELDRFAGTLLGRGWEGLVSVEVLSGDLQALSIDDFARAAHDSALRYFS
jgi:sugar phosphate isomerase/epimerase